MEYKKCTKCGNTLPATRDFFFENKKGKNGLESQCKNCVKLRRRKRYQNIIYEIYCITTDTYYIGQTTKTITERISKHFSDAKRGREQPLYVDIRRYGRDMFTYRVIEIVDDKKKLDDLERFYIRKYLNENKKIYNIENGGQKGSKFLKNIITPFIVCDAYGYIYGKYNSTHEAFNDIGKFNYKQLLNNTQLNDKNLLIFSEDIFTYELYCHECKAYIYLEDDMLCNKKYRNNSGENNAMYGRKGKDNPNSKSVYIIKNGIIERFYSASEASNKYNFQVRGYARGECNHYYRKQDIYIYYEYNLPEHWRFEKTEESYE